MAVTLTKFDSSEAGGTPSDFRTRLGFQPNLGCQTCVDRASFSHLVLGVKSNGEFTPFSGQALNPRKNILFTTSAHLPATDSKLPTLSDVAIQVLTFDCDFPAIVSLWERPRKGNDFEWTPQAENVIAMELSRCFAEPITKKRLLEILNQAGIPCNRLKLDTIHEMLAMLLEKEVKPTRQASRKAAA